MTILSQGWRKARKTHWCDGWTWLDECRNDYELIDVCEGIAKGDEYYYQTHTDDGLQTFKCCKSCKAQAASLNILMREDYY